MPITGRTSTPVIRSMIDDGAPLTQRYWAELHTFLAVARLGSSNRAAEVLNLSRMSVLRHLRRLNDVFKADLVIVSKRGTFLTDRGRELADEVARFDTSMFALATDIRRERGKPQGIVRVSISDGLGLIFVSPTLADFAAEYPDILVHLKRPSNERSLHENRTDIMVSFVNDLHEDVISQRLGTVHFYPFGSVDYLRRREARDISDPAIHSFIDTERFSAGADVWAPWRAAMARGHVQSACDTSITYAALVKAGVGVGLLPTFNVFDPQMQPVHIGVGIDVPLYIVAMAERMKSKPIRLVFDLLAGILGPDTAVLSHDRRLEFAPDEKPRGYELLSMT